MKLRDTRITPTSTPSAVALTMPRPATSKVFSAPTSSSWAIRPARPPMRARVGIEGRLNGDSAHRRGVHQPRLLGVPQGVHAPLELQGRVSPNVALEDLPIVPLGLDGAIGPVVAQAQHLAETRLHAQQAAHLRIGACATHLVDVPVGDAELLGQQGGVEGPADDVLPLVVALE